MKRCLKSALACAALFTLSHPVLAADPPAAKLSGHYYLEGVNEVGSELLLKKDGKFQWGLSYGAVDQQADGTWTVAGNKVNLVTSSPDGEPVFKLFTEDEFKKLGSHDEQMAGQWKAEVGIPGRGGMPDVEIKFEANSGKSAIALTSGRGEAVVRMTGSEIWTRAGLRRKGSKGDYQWLAIPPRRAQERVAAFTLTDPKWLGNQAFKTLSFDIVANGLKAGPESMLSRGVYVMRPAN